MKCIARLLTALVAMWAVSGHAQTVFPISENDVDASGRNFLRRSSRRIVTDTGSVIIATSIIVCGSYADGGTVAV
jgi:hypothetical protein